MFLVCTVLLQTVISFEARHVSLLVAAFGCDDFVRPRFFFEANDTIAGVHLSPLRRSLVFRVVDEADWHPGQRLVTWALACRTVYHVFLADAVYVEQVFAAKSLLWNRSFGKEYLGTFVAMCFAHGSSCLSIEKLADG